MHSQGGEFLRASMGICDIAIVGAGPYGLSAAAHLKAGGMDVRVFGECMSFWESHMPEGMLLRSPWAGSHFSDPRSQFTLNAFKLVNGNHLSAPLPLRRFIDYGRWFQRCAVPHVDSRKVARIEFEPRGFRLLLEDGEPVTSRRVVVAGGILPFARKPLEFSNLSAAHASHTSEHRDLVEFRGRRLIVIGAGQSALETAALLHQMGTEVELIVRAPAIRWLHQRPSLHRWPVCALLYAWPDVGPAGLSHVIAAPNLFNKLPRALQDRLARRSIRAAGAAWLKARLQGVPITLNRTIRSATVSRSVVKLTLDDGSEREADHVLLATGYRVNIGLYRFLSELLTSIRQVDGYPVLDSAFGSSLPGLHFLGSPAAWSFGPLMRFVAGADFASRALAQGIMTKLRNARV
jgi:cation diffusion facilitator CzcD-associated flavoprotein CzcO